MSDHKGKRTPWFLRSTPPTRPGLYECGVHFTSALQRPVLWDLPWDGNGFVVPFPMVVRQWRGLAADPCAKDTQPKVKP